MIVERDGVPSAAERTWELRPNRALSARQLCAFFAIMSGASAAVAGYSFSQGNVYAPAFALAELGALALCLRLVWRRLSAYERVRLNERELVVEAQGGRTSFHPFWVRLHRDGEGRLRLGSHGREIEVGALLPEHERDQLAESVREALSALRVTRTE